MQHMVLSLSMRVCGGLLVLTVHQQATITLSIGSPLTISDQVSCPHEAAGKIIVLYLLILIAVGSRFSAPIQTTPGGPPSLLYSGYRVFAGVKWLGLVIGHPPHLALRLKKE